MPLNEKSQEQLINTVSLEFPTEIHYYTHPKVQTTAHAVGDPDKANWTKELYENKIIKTLPNTGDRFVEIERTLTALYCYFLMGVSFEESYKAFSACQKDNPEIKSSEIISEEQFKKVYIKTNSILNKDIDKQSVLKYLIIYSDIGKSPGFRELVSELCNKSGIEIDTSLDSDDLIVEILKKFSDEQISEILPSFSKLSTSAKEMLRTIYPIMQACFGHLYFLERGHKTLDVIASALQKIPAEKRNDALDIVYLAQFFDGMGAQGQRKIAGSLTCTNSFAEGYHLMHLTLKELQASLAKTNNIDIASQSAFKYYLGERAKWLGFDECKSPEQQFLTRLGCTLRGFIPEVGKILLEEFKELKLTHQKLLIEQLDFSQQGLEGWTKVNYIATIAQNASRELFSKDKIREAIRAALQAEVCFAMLIKEMSDKYPQIVHDEKRSISFGEIAFLATKNPELFNPEKFIASDYILDPIINKIIKAPQKLIVAEEKLLSQKKPIETTGLTGSTGHSMFINKSDIASPSSCANNLLFKKIF